MHCHEFKKIPITEVAVTVSDLSKGSANTKLCQQNSDTEQVCIIFHLHYPDHVTSRHATKRPRVSMSRDLQWLLFLFLICQQCHCQSVADCTVDITIEHFASRFSDIFAKVRGKFLATFQVIECGSGGG